MRRLLAAVGVVLFAAAGLVAADHPARAVAVASGSVLVVGDSLTVGAQTTGGLVTRFAAEGVSVDVVAESSRDTRWALAQVQARPAVPSEVVVYLGTNRIEGDFRSGVDRLLDALVARGASGVLWLTPLRFGDSGAYADRVAVLHDVAAARPALLRVADWHVVATAHPAWDAGDRIHLNGDGYRALAGFMVAQRHALQGPPQPTGSQRAAAVVDAARVFVAALGRDPDAAGLAYWAEALATGAPLGSVAGAISHSAEFAGRYPAIDDGGFVDLVYRNVLGRLPDPAGRSYWHAELLSGRPRGELVAVIGLSVEAIASRPAAGLVGAVDPHAGTVGRTYRVVLGRDPEDAGLLYWTARSWEGMGDQGLAAALVSSGEHRATLGGTSDAAFVEVLYRNGLGRSPDPAGWEYWVARLAAGAPRAAVAVAVAASEETRQRTGYLA